MPLTPPAVQEPRAPFRDHLSVETVAELEGAHAFWESIDTDAQWHLRVRFDSQLAKLKSLAYLSKGWDGYVAERPTNEALGIASNALHLMYASRLEPTDVIPSAEGGVAIVFSSATTLAQVEFLNGNEIVWVGYHGKNEPEAGVFDLTDHGMGAAIEQIQGFLSR